MISSIDTNAILRIIIGDLPDQLDKSLHWLRSQQPHSVLLLDAVLVEVLFQLEAKAGYHLKRSDYLTDLFGLLEATQWDINQTTRRALGFFADTNLDYADCLLLAMKSSGKLDRVFTFDKGLLKHL